MSKRFSLEKVVFQTERIISTLLRDKRKSNTVGTTTLIGQILLPP